MPDPITDLKPTNGQPEIPADLIDATARAQFNADQEPERLNAWEDIGDWGRQAYRNRARAGLAAAQLPSLLAGVDRLRRERDEVAANEAEAIVWKQDFGVLSDAVNDLYLLHAPTSCGYCPESRSHKVCSHCGHWVTWPCPTVQRLDQACLDLSGTETVQR